jgi:hypothetical protein
VAPGHNTPSQDTRPAIGKNIADKANRDGMAERFPAAVQTTIAVARARILYAEALRTALARSLVQTAKHHAAQTLSRLHPIPGIGQILSRVWLYARHQSDRCPRVQDCASSGRLVTGRKASGGTRLGTSGKKNRPCAPHMGLV